MKFQKKILWEKNLNKLDEKVCETARSFGEIFTNLNKKFNKFYLNSKKNLKIGILRKTY